MNLWMQSRFNRNKLLLQKKTYTVFIELAHNA